MGSKSKDTSEAPDHIDSFSNEMVTIDVIFVDIQPIMVVEEVLNVFIKTIVDPMNKMVPVALGNDYVVLQKVNSKEGIEVSDLVY